MRSVVVVLPASMWALMPMLRYLSMGVVRGISYHVLKPKMRKGFIGFGHPVHFLALFDRPAAAFRRFQQFSGETLTHRFLAALARRLAQPAHRERHPAHGTTLDRHPEVRAAHHVIADARQILDATAADQHDRVLLKIVAFAADVADDFEAVGQAGFRDFPQRRVRLFRRRRVDPCADAALLRALLERWYLAFRDGRRTALPHELIDGWHLKIVRSGCPECAVALRAAGLIGVPVVRTAGFLQTQIKVAHACVAWIRKRNRLWATFLRHDRLPRSCKAKAAGRVREPLMLLALLPNARR